MSERKAVGWIPIEVVARRASDPLLAPFSEGIQRPVAYFVQRNGHRATST